MKLCTLNGVDLTIGEREFIAVVGSSGSGKSARHMLGLWTPHPMGACGLRVRRYRKFLELIERTSCYTDWIYFSGV